MKKLFVFWILACFVVAVPAQQKRTTATKARTAQKQPARKTAPQKKQQPVTVKGLKNEQEQVRKQIKEQERRLQANERDVKKRLQNLLVINNEIADKRKTIDTIRNDITRLDEDIQMLQTQLTMLQQELNERQQRFVKSMRYMHRNRDVQNRLMFIFSAHNFTQMYRRLRFVREYAIYQQAQGEAVKAMQEQVGEAYEELAANKRQKSSLLVRGEQEKKHLESKQEEQQKMVTSLQKQQKTIQGIIDKQKKRDAELNGQIDRLVAQEIARAKARAEAEARAAARKKAAEKAAAERKAREAEKARLAAERKTTGKTAGKAPAEVKTSKKEVAETRKTTTTNYAVSSEDRLLSGNFESNRGRLPMPIVGNYSIVNHFGTNTVSDVKGSVTLDKKGIDIKGQPGASVRCIYDGEVSAVFGYAGTTVVIIRHGNYLSVYCDLASVSVRRGQKVTTRQTIGRVGSDGLMQFQLRKGSAKLNPRDWLAR